MNPLDLFSNPMTGPVSLQQAALALLLAFGLTQAIAAVYIWTFRGMSYSRSFVQAVALGSIIAAMLMLAINTISPQDLASPGRSRLFDFERRCVTLVTLSLIHI